MTGCPTSTKNIPQTKHPVARAFLGCKKYPRVRPGPIITGIPHTNSRLPNLMSVLLKNSVIPKAVNAAPEDRKMTPNLRLPDVSTVGSFDLDDDDDEGLRLFF